MGLNCHGLFPPVNGKHLKNKSFFASMANFGPWAAHFGRFGPLPEAACTVLRAKRKSRPSKKCGEWDMRIRHFALAAALLLATGAAAESAPKENWIGAWGFAPIPAPPGVAMPAAAPAIVPL